MLQSAFRLFLKNPLHFSMFNPFQTQRTINIAKRTKHGLTKGFTLIELLIVVAIIGILSALLMTNFIGIRQRARDAQRKADIRQIQSSLELYRSDTGSYPAANGTKLNANSCPTPSAFKSGDGSTTYMNQIPCDPLGTTNVFNNGNYFYETTTGGYEVGACLENSADTDAYPGTFDGANNATCTTGKYFVKTNP